MRISDWSSDVCSSDLLGKDVTIQSTVMSPDGRWLLVVTQAKDADAGKGTHMPGYVTEYGYKETEDTRPLFGCDRPADAPPWLADNASGAVSELGLHSLRGHAPDPRPAMAKWWKRALTG